MTIYLTLNVEQLAYKRLKNKISLLLKLHDTNAVMT